MKTLSSEVGRILSIVRGARATSLVYVIGAVTVSITLIIVLLILCREIVSGIVQFF
jgi:high-affinity Fe2+/Pb2+ permease